MSDGYSFIMEIRLNRESLAETRNGPERERKSVLETFASPALVDNDIGSKV